MKRAILLLLILCLLAGCSGNKGPATGTAAIEKLETIGDAIELEGANFEQSALYGETFLYAFSLDDTYYRVTAWTPPDIADAMWVLDRTAPDFKDQLNGLAKSQPIRTYENLSDRLLKPEDREKLVGREAGVLLDNGWTCIGYNLSDMIFDMTFGPFVYQVKLEGELDAGSTFTDESLRHLRIDGIQGWKLGDVTVPEE